MPIANYPRLKDFAAKAGAEIPRWMRRRLDGFADDEAGLRAFADEAVTTLCSRLVEGGAPGLHFYTLNRAGPTAAVLANLRLPARASVTVRDTVGEPLTLSAPRGVVGKSPDGAAD